MTPNPSEADTTSDQRQQDASLHQAAWPDMLSSLHVAYGDLTRTQLELERRMAEIGDVGRIAALLHEHAPALSDYLTSDPKGKQTSTDRWRCRMSTAI
jgi:hypothetical protein